jgi:hypothetical protein
LYVFQRACEEGVRNVTVEVREIMVYVKDHVFGDVIHDVEAGAGDEIACLDPPAARVARDKRGVGRFGTVVLAPVQVRIRKVFVDGLGRFLT